MISFPKGLTVGIQKFLEKKLMDLKRNEKELKEVKEIEDDADDQVEHFENQVKANFIQKQVIQIRKALTRLKLGKYGTCEKCGQMIDTDRLSVNPETTTCVKCAREDEK